MSLFTNALVRETSPYLLQHAHNPVNWFPWGSESLALAKAENKPILLSIGYAACHWCHVMEHESFEDEAVAAVMNKHFINIKLDREERPDIDSVYMEAVQLMGLNGGWPLNVFLMPDGRPFYGGTYFPKKNWVNLLQQIAEAWTNHPIELEESAEQFRLGISRSESEKYGLNFMSDKESAFQIESVETYLRGLLSKIDFEWGGFNRAPKFPLPGAWKFLELAQRLPGIDKLLKEQAQKATAGTLEKMAIGGLYDQIGGGFTRYSTDSYWFVPHFEKMLYDNGQLLELFALSIADKPLNYRILNQTISFIERELLSPSGGIYASLDADSEGEEGKFYCWSESEFETAAGDLSEFGKAFYQITPHGNWEEGKNIPWSKTTIEAYSESKGFSIDETVQKLDLLNDRLLQLREKRVRPGLDNKLLASWNGLALSGLCRAYQAIDNQKAAELATGIFTHLKTLHIHEGKLFRTPIDKPTPITGFLDDYAAVVKGLIDYHEVFSNDEALFLAKNLIETSFIEFHDSEEGYFFYTPNSGEALIARKKELFDNVIPASNSLMAECLQAMGRHFPEKGWFEIAENWTLRMAELIAKEPSWLFQWAQVSLRFSIPKIEIAIQGKDAAQWRKSLSKSPFEPFCRISFSEKAGSMAPLLQNRVAPNGQTYAWLCRDNACSLPIDSFENLMEDLNAVFTSL